MNEQFYKDIELIRSDQYQWDAYTSKGNTVVIAGPGSGKTRVLILKAIKILHTVLGPTSGLACLSYSRETVRELKNRLELYDYRSSPKDYVGTVHGFCLAQIIGPYQNLYPEYGIPYPLKIASAELRRTIYLGVLKDLNKNEKSLSMTSLEKARYFSIPGSSRVVMDSDPEASKAAEMYEERLKNSGHLDFTQMAKLATRMIQEKKYIRDTLEAKYPWLLIDEYQDLGKALHETVLTLQSLTDIKIFVVGDMDQSIYGFQGAYPDFLNEIRENENFIRIKLKYNYRSNQDVISASLTALNPAPPSPDYEARLRLQERAEFTFITCKAEITDQFQCVADKIIPKLVDKGIALNEIAVIVSSNSDASELAQILRKKQIPAYIVKWNFDVQSDIVQWLMECSQWCADSKTKSFDKIFNYWNYIVKTHGGCRVSQDEMKLRIDFLEVLGSSKNKPVLHEWLGFLIGELELGELLRDSERYPDERENLKLLIEDAENGSLRNFTVETFVKIGHPENEVTVITRHSVKGLEFEAVIMLGMEEGRFPFYLDAEGSRELREAHRLCYVCVSRAKKVCVLLFSTQITTYSQWGAKVRQYAPSRFWKSLHEKFGSDNNTFLAEHY